METAEPSGLTPAQAAAQRLRIDYAAAEVLRGLDAERIPSILLKGAAVVRWLYEPGERRAYMDCDLLVSPDSFGQACQVLARLGFEPELEEARMPAWWRAHGVAWLRASDGVAIDLHRTLTGAQAPPKRVWDALSRRTQPIDVAGVQTRSLDVPGLVLHLALHVAQHGGAGHHVRELELAIARADDGTWQAVAHLAREIDAGAAVRTGLRFVPPGPALADRLDLPQPGVQGLLAARGFAEAQTVARFAQSGLVARGSMIRYKVVPPATFMRLWSPLARRGRLGLLAAYLWRPIWLLRWAPVAIRQWRSAQTMAGADPQNDSAVAVAVTVADVPTSDPAADPHRAAAARRTSR